MVSYSMSFSYENSLLLILPPNPLKGEFPGHLVKSPLGDLGVKELN